jgi:plastocyanin
MKIQFTLATLLAACVFSIGCADGTTPVAKTPTQEATTQDDTFESKVPAQQASARLPNQDKQEDAKANTKAASDDSGAWGHLSGTITVDGEVKPPAEEAVGDHADKAVCLVDGKIPVDDNIIVNPDNKGLQNVYVLMYEKKKKPEAYHPSYEEAKSKPVVLDNINCRFVPHAVFVRTGQKLTLKNSDPVGHNCHITTFNNEHNPTLPANSEAEVTFDAEDTRLGSVTCDLHKWMDGAIFIRDNPYVAITDADGKFTIENLPEGDWEFQFIHKKVGYLKKLEISNYKVSKKGVVKVGIKSNETMDLGEMKLPAKSLK